MQIILASASPRRRQILGEILSDFLVIPAQGEERADLTLPPAQIVCALAKAKAAEIALEHADALVIGSDTIVYFDGKVLGKPKSEEDAFHTLKSLSGREHSVFTGLCLIKGEKEIAEAVESRVLFHELSDEFISSYVKSGSPMDKAGSYGIQDGGLVKSYFGSYTNIIGLPKEKLQELLRKFL